MDNLSLPRQILATAPRLCAEAEPRGRPTGR